MKINWFMALVALLEFGAAGYELYQGNLKLAGVYFFYGVASVFLAIL